MILPIFFFNNSLKILFVRSGALAAKVCVSEKGGKTEDEWVTKVSMQWSVDLNRRGSACFDGVRWQCGFPLKEPGLVAWTMQRGKLGDVWLRA